ncbi:ImuA family protein [Elioraea thermophila]|uniref:ImuA family protein n=1 Tax=Elioraea thermophila TaxID=2185104 RepID=UPI000DF1498E|nr:hypothetical protein [Elioraea thermophila]
MPATPHATDDRRTVLDRLRARLARLETPPARPALSPLPLAPAIDRALPWRGLCRGALHEIVAADEGAGVAFACLIAARAGPAVAWIATRPDPCPAGLRAWGIDPAGLLVVRARPEDLLWAAEECFRNKALDAVLLFAPALSLTTSRRLHLAAEESGCTGLILQQDIEGRAPSAARSRWRVSPLPGAAGPAHLMPAPRWRLELLRARGGDPAAWTVQWDEARRALLVEGRADG